MIVKQSKSCAAEELVACAPGRLEPFAAQDRPPKLLCGKRELYRSRIYTCTCMRMPLTRVIRHFPNHQRLPSGSSGRIHGRIPPIKGTLRGAPNVAGGTSPICLTASHLRGIHMDAYVPQVVSDRMYTSVPVPISDRDFEGLQHIHLAQPKENPQAKVS